MRMKMRKFISLLLLAVYLFAAGGSSYASLSCRCLTLKGQIAHSCCHHCEHVGLASDKALDAPCCGDDHSTEVKLYTGSAGGNTERYVKCCVCALPPSLTAECPQLIDPLLIVEALSSPRTPFFKEEYILSVGFRAPPVLA